VLRVPYTSCLCLCGSFDFSLTKIWVPHLFPPFGKGWESKPYSCFGNFPLIHSPSFSSGTRNPIKNCPNSAYSALTWSNRIS
jgi:hypothetical protein